MTEQEFKAKLFDLIERGVYTKDTIHIWLSVFRKNTDGTYSNTGDGINSTIDQSVVNSWLATEASEPVTIQNPNDLTDEQKVRLTSSALAVLNSFENTISLERQATNAYLSIYSQKESGLNEVINECEQDKIADQESMRQQQNMFYISLSARGLLQEGSSEGARLIAEEKEKERLYVENNYNRCVSFAQSLYVVPSSLDYRQELQNWLLRLDKYSEAISFLRNGLADGINTVDKMLDYKNAITIFDRDFSQERGSIDYYRKSITQSSSNTSDLLRQAQENLDQARANIQIDKSQEVSCVPGLQPSSYSCNPLNGSSRFNCTVGSFGTVSCVSSRY